ncbi:transposase [Streptomyces decoyicus]
MFLGSPDVGGVLGSGWFHGARGLTNAEWRRLASFLPRGGARGGRWSDHRRVINRGRYRVRTGVQWCPAALE